MDYSAGLMWVSNCFAVDSREDAIGLSHTLNDNNFGGFTSWRLPTLIEIASLLPSDIKSYTDYPGGKPFSFFREWSNTVWTIDSSSRNRALAYSFKNGDAFEPTQEHLLEDGVHARFVRTVSTAN